MVGGAHQARWAMLGRMDTPVLLELQVIAAVCLVVRKDIRDG